MRRLLAGLAALAVLGVCVPSYGVIIPETAHYILVYKGIMKATKTLFDVNDTNNLLSGSMQCYLAIDINDAGDDKGEVLDSNAVIYDAKEKYYKVVPNTIEIQPNDPCRAEALEFYMGDAEGGCAIEVIGTGKLTKVYNEPDAALKKYVPTTMNGIGWLFEYDVFAPSNTLFGTLTASMKLDPKLTQNANSNGDDVNDVINSIVAHQLTGWRNWPYNGHGMIMTAPPAESGSN
jgi:hypothetical protein